MLRVGQEEVEAVGKVLLSGKVFRYHRGAACLRFERRFARYIGVKHVRMTASGTHSLAAAMIGLGIGPGMEVLVPCHTFMATATSVLGVGAIPVLVDVDESITMDPEAMADAIGPRTAAVIPVHMWGWPCDMGPIMRIARKHKLLVIEDACQAVGGAYRGKMLGSIGHAGAFSFNYYKNITCGEGGAVVTDSARVMKRASCATDCGSFYWSGRDPSLRPFASIGARASEIEGAIMNVQLDRLPGMIRTLRRQKNRILAATARNGLRPVRANAPQEECATHVGYLLPTASQAQRFASLVGGTVIGKTGRHVYTEWDPVLDRRGAHHPALDPFKLGANKGCRMSYRKDMYKRSLELLNRAVMIGLHPDRKPGDVKDLIGRINDAARRVLAAVRAS